MYAPSRDPRAKTCHAAPAPLSGGRVPLMVQAVARDARTQLSTIWLQKQAPTLGGCHPECRSHLLDARHLHVVDLG